MWKFLHDSVTGISHEKSGLECQDRCIAKEIARGEDRFLAFACADGAGSAQRSQVGAQIAVDHAIVAVERALNEGRVLTDFTADDVIEWLTAIREAIAIAANEAELALRDFACTLLIGIASDDCSLFAQIGDGAIVINDIDGYRPVFWPQSGEYHNTTYFITDDEFSKNLQWQCLNENVAEIAVFTDGLQMLALNYTEQKAHSPFFKPLFASLKAAEKTSDLATPLRDFLGSPSINERTDDDKSLILAVRIDDRAPDT